MVKRVKLPKGVFYVRGLSYEKTSPEDVGEDGKPVK
jgi:hypothetical protein